MNECKVINFLKSLSFEDRQRLFFECGACRYTSARGPTKGKPCGEKTEDGKFFCSKHKHSVQAKNFVPSEKEEISEEKEPTKEEIPEEVTIEQSRYGNYVYMRENKLPLIIDVEEQIVLGTEGRGGQIEKLTAEDINLCEKFGWDYVKEEKEEEKEEQSSSSESEKESEEEDYSDY